MNNLKTIRKTENLPKFWLKAIYSHDYKSVHLENKVESWSVSCARVGGAPFFIRFTLIVRAALGSLGIVWAPLSNAPQESRCHSALSCPIRALRLAIPLCTRPYTAEGLRL